MLPSRVALVGIALATAGCLAPPRASSSNGSPSMPAASGPAQARPVSSSESGWMIFLLIGQSNMVGAPKPEPADQVENPRIEVLAYDTCPNLGQSYDRWYVAKPPLHDCYGGVGPGDNFAKAVAAAYPNATIGLVPLAINGVDVDFFSKGVVSARRKEFRIPPDNHWTGAYEWVLERARLAQQKGAIRGILFHQGESDAGKPDWVTKVKTMVADLRTDLGLGEVPFVAGELLYSGCCGKWHNPLVSRLAHEIPNARIVSADGLDGQDAAHFNLPAQRELGARYGAAMLDLLKASAKP